MINYYLALKLISDATFGRGDGVAGLVDQEVEHDNCGFPYLRGRTLKGLLSEECDNWIQVLPSAQQGNWNKIANQLFGIPGSGIETIAQMSVGDACLPQTLRNAVALQIDQEENSIEGLKPKDVLDSLTTIRRQTAIAPETGTPDRGSLRSGRVILRDLEFVAPLSFATKPSDRYLQLLAIGALSLRRVGSGRNRGRGQVICRLLNANREDVTQHYFEQYAAAQEIAS